MKNILWDFLKLGTKNNEGAQNDEKSNRNYLNFSISSNFCLSLLDHEKKINRLFCWWIFHSHLTQKALTWNLNYLKTLLSQSFSKLEESKLSVKIFPVNKAQTIFSVLLTLEHFNFHSSFQKKLGEIVESLFLCSYLNQFTLFKYNDFIYWLKGVRWF